MGPKRICTSVADGAETANAMRKWARMDEADVRNMTVDNMREIDELDLQVIPQSQRDLIVLTHLDHLYALPNFPNKWAWKVEWGMKFKAGLSTVDRLNALESITVHVNAAAVEIDSWEVFVASLKDAQELNLLNVLKCNLGKATKAQRKLGPFMVERVDVEVRHNLGSNADSMRALVWNHEVD